VRVLLAAGADPKKAARGGRGPLLGAVPKGDYDIARPFIERGGGINHGKPKRWTPPLPPVFDRKSLRTPGPPPPSDGALDFIKLLLDRGADPNHRIKFRTEVHQANSALWLQEAGATGLLRASLCGDLAVVKLLLAHGADPLIPTFDHTTPLMAASGVGWAEGF